MRGFLLCCLWQASDRRGTLLVNNEFTLLLTCTQKKEKRKESVNKYIIIHKPKQPLSLSLFLNKNELNVVVLTLVTLPLFGGLRRCLTNPYE